MALALVGAAGCTTLLGDGYEVVAEDAAVHHDAASESGHARDAKSRDALVKSEAATDAGCMALMSLSNKSAFESTVCGGLTCTAADNAELAGNTHCTDDAGAIACALPAYTPADAGAPDAAQADGGHHDAGPVLPKCSALPALSSGFKYPSTILYAIGSTAIQPYVAHIAQLLAAGVPSVADGGTATSATVIYAAAGSCVGVEAAFAPAGSSPPPINTLATTANYYDPMLDPQGNPIPYTCELDSTAPADLGISDVFPSSCTGLPFAPPTDPLPAPYYDFYGPVQVMEMLVPVRSAATTISYEQAGLVWGYGDQAMVSPWTDSTLLFRRSASSGTQTMISLAIGLDPRSWVGVAEATTTGVKTALLNVQMTGLPDGGTPPDPNANAAKTMGILASDVADGLRQSVRPLAFQDRGERCAWLPDTSLASFDKRNVRDGHYPIWGPSHFITTVDSSFIPKPTVAKVIAALSGTDPDVSKLLDVIQLYATNHVVPTCAMHVSRTSDGASYVFYQPPGKSACGCYYDDQVPLDATTCTPCTGDSDCTGAPGGATSCNVFGLPPKGFCEVPGP